MRKWIIEKEDDGSILVALSNSKPSVKEGYTLIGETDSLPDRRFRCSWVADGESLKIDLAKARALRLAEIREERDRRLKESDEKWIEVKTKGGDTRSIETLKQTLRNIPEAAEQVLASKLSVNTIKAYDPFEDLD